MNNVIKRTILLIIVALGILVLPKHIVAANLKVNDDYTLHSIDFLSDDLFCAQHGQNLFFPNKAIPYKVIRKITINRSNVIVEKGNGTETITDVERVNKYQQLAYILSLKNDYQYTDWKDYENRPKQKLIWHHLHVTGILNISCNDSEYDSTIYTEATTSSNYKYCTGTIFVLENKKYSWEAFDGWEAGGFGAGGAQHIIIGEGQMDKKPTANVNIKKTSTEVDEYALINGAQFNVRFKNIDSATLSGYSGTIVNDRDYPITAGKIDISDINGNNNEGTYIEITLTEVSAPTGYKITKPTTKIYIKQDCSQYKIDNGGWTNISDGATISVNIENQPLINLSGNVWQDAQIGEKEVSGPNGLKDSGESSIKDVIVELYSIKDKKVIDTTTTDGNGNYKFENINKTNEGYKITFKYNGIKYNATTTDPGISKGTELDRVGFNNKFKTISEGKSNGVADLTYTYSDKKSVLNATVQGHTTGTTDAKFQISAETPVYTNTTDNVNLGLVERYFDLSIGTDVKSAKLKINDREIEYSYAQIMDGKMEDLTLDKILQNNSSTAENIKYNLYLYTSDYNYRISDYKMGNEAISNKLNGEDNGVNNYDNLKELEAYVTYSIILKNQSTHDATVDEFVYYYDKAYIPQFKNGDVIDGYRVVSIDEDKIKFEKVNDNVVLSKNNSYRKEIDLTFKVNGDERGIVALKENCTNIAEITKYSTNEGGLIDNDSAPGNADVKFENGTPKIGQYEDDTDEAKGLKISLKDESRTITGTVFEDLNKDGVSNDNKQVKDVIVQLIEIKTINGKNREYIWQETRSGSNTVKTTARNGYPGEGYINNVSEEGKYEFKDYIPGNYIIRYIYGDGTTYDITDNVKKYNGQDYKSTIDEHYQAEWYNKANYAQDASVARDNEARRLKVMAYSTMIEKTNGNNLVEMNAEALKGTWMAAETSKLNVPIDSNTTPTEKSTVLYDTMNFGLALRPETKLVLEKHITGLKITPSGTGVQPIVDARANIEQVINEGKIDTTGVTTGLATIKSDRSERGFWKVETDIEELAQGAQLEVEYTYVIRNDSDEDYLSSNLVENYINSIEDGNYAKYLTSKASEVQRTNTKIRNILRTILLHRK